MAYPTLAWLLKRAGAGTQPIAEVSATQRHPLGAIVSAFDQTYGEGQFIYLAGAASTAAGSVATYNSKSGATTLGAAGVRGQVAVAAAPTIASTYGWYQISGACPVKSGTVAAGTPAYLAASASVDDAVVAGDQIDGMVITSTDSGGFATCQLSWPSATGQGGAAATLAAGRTITLTAAVEAAQAIVVTGQIKDFAGANIAAAAEVLVRTLAVTDDKGDITVTTGTSRKVVNPTTGENVAYITTDATGGFAFSVANDAVEVTLVQATANNALAAALKLTFT